MNELPATHEIRRTVKFDIQIGLDVLLYPLQPVQVLLHPHVLVDELQEIICDPEGRLQVRAICIDQLGLRIVT